MIDLYSETTPNGQKIHIMLEEPASTTRPSGSTSIGVNSSSPHS